MRRPRLGPSLHPREAARSLDHRPRTPKVSTCAGTTSVAVGVTRAQRAPIHIRAFPSGADSTTASNCNCSGAAVLKAPRPKQLLTSKENLPAYGPNRPLRPLPPSKKVSTLPVLLQRPRPTAGRATGTPPGQGNKLTTLLMTSTTSTLPIRKESFPSCRGMLEAAGGLTRMLTARPLSDLANPSRTHPVLRLTRN